MLDIRNTGLEMEMFVLVAVEASSSMNEYGRDALWPLPKPQHSVQSTVGAVGGFYHAVRYPCIMSTSSCRDESVLGSIAPAHEDMRWKYCEFVDILK